MNQKDFHLHYSKNYGNLTGVTRLKVVVNMPDPTCLLENNLYPTTLNVCDKFPQYGKHGKITEIQYETENCGKQRFCISGSVPCDCAEGGGGAKRTSERVQASSRGGEYNLTRFRNPEPGLTTSFIRLA